MKNHLFKMKLDIILVIFILSFSGCFQPIVIDDDVMILASTTSMRDSGLLDILLDEFTKSTGIEVDYVAVGTGAALNLGKSGDVDILIVHAPELEEEFIEAGFGFNRTIFTWNYFILLAPESYTKNLNLSDTLTEIIEQEKCFISRGDGSGTHIKEQELWLMINQTKGIEMIDNDEGYHPIGEWYLSIGQGMSAAITMADQKDCFTLSDKGTHLNRADTDLIGLEFSEEVLLNPYSIILLESPHQESTEKLQNFILNEGRLIIENHSINGQQLFF